MTEFSMSNLKQVKAAESASFGSTSNPQPRQHSTCSALKLDLNPGHSFLPSCAKGLLAYFTGRFLFSLWIGLDSGQLLRLFTASAIKALVAGKRARKQQ